MHYPCSPTDNTCHQSVHLVPTALYPWGEVGIGKSGALPLPPSPRPLLFLALSAPCLEVRPSDRRVPSLLPFTEARSPGPLPGSLRPASKPFVRLPEGPAAISFSHTDIRAADRAGQAWQWAFPVNRISMKALAQLIVGVYDLAGLGGGGLAGVLSWQSGRRVNTAGSGPSCQPLLL